MWRTKIRVIATACQPAVTTRNLQTVIDAWYMAQKELFMGFAAALVGASTCCGVACMCFGEVYMFLGGYVFWEEGTTEQRSACVIIVSVASMYCVPQLFIYYPTCMHAHRSDCCWIRTRAYALDIRLRSHRWASWLGCSRQGLVSVHMGSMAELLKAGAKEKGRGSQ